MTDERPKPPTKRQRMKQVVDYFLQHAEVTEIRQRCPWTYVAVRIVPHKDVSPIAQGLMGFSKVCWPDKWSEEEGERLAVERAVVWFVRANPRLLEEGKEDEKVLSA